MHKFHVGQAVELAPNALRPLAPGPYEVRHLVPASDRDPSDPCYRIKSVDETYERVALQSELSPSNTILA